MKQQIKIRKKVKDYQFEATLQDFSEDELKKYVGTLFNHVTTLSEQKKEDPDLGSLLDKYKELCEVRYNGQLKDYKKKLMLARGIMKLRGIQGVKEIDEMIAKTHDPFIPD